MIDCYQVFVLTQSNTKIIQAFVSGLANQPRPPVESGTVSHARPYQMCKTVESVLNLSAVNLTLPAHFRESVILYIFTGSRLALKMMGSGGAYASYQAVKSWLTSLASNPPEVPNGDLVLAFDNNQVLQRRWKVRLRNGVKCNIVTVLVSCVIKEKGMLEYDINLKPGIWWNNELSEADKIRIKYIDQDDRVKHAHYEHLCSFVQKQIQLVAAEQEIKNPSSGFTDNIDRLVILEKKALIYKTCYQVKAHMSKM